MKTRKRINYCGNDPHNGVNCSPYDGEIDKITDKISDKFIEEKILPPHNLRELVKFEIEALIKDRNATAGEELKRCWGSFLWKFNIRNNKKSINAIVQIIKFKIN